MTRKIDYPYIRAWGQYLDQHTNYVGAQLKLARQEGAPQTAIYRRGADGTWADYEEIVTWSMRGDIDAIVDRYGYGRPTL